MELYVNARNVERPRLAPPDGADGLRPSHQMLLRLADMTDPAWPSVAGVLREMADAGVEINEAALAIAVKIGAYRHKLALIDSQKTRSRRPAYHQATIAGITSDSIIYYIRRGNIVKIGTTTDPVSRLADLMPDEILAFEPGGMELERVRHRQFDHLRHRGEYFSIAPELLEHARQLRRLHGEPDPSWPNIAKPQGPLAFAALPPLVSHEMTTVDEACERFGITKTTIWSWVRRGLISSAGREGRRHLFYVEHLAAINARMATRRRRQPKSVRKPGDT